MSNREQILNNDRQAKTKDSEHGYISNERKGTDKRDHRTIKRNLPPKARKDLQDRERNYF